jgi:hypothetical protein
MCVSWQENTNLKEEKQSELTIRIFMLTYNCEIHTSKAIEHMLLLYEQSSSMLYQIHGQMNTSISRADIMHDVNAILKMMEIRDNVKISEKICNPTRLRNESTQYSRIHEKLKCRPSLSMLRKTVLNSRRKDGENVNVQSLSSDDKILVDLPLHNEIWLTKSSTEKQIILLIISLDMKKIKSKYTLILELFGNVVDESVDTCIVAPPRMAEISKHTILILSKLNSNVDMEDADLIKLMEQFSQDCFVGIFGTMQRDLMTISFCVQMYIIAYTTVDTQSEFYKEAVFYFNKKIQNIHRELMINEYVSPQLLSNMAVWTAKHDFSNTCMSIIFKTITI